LLVEHAGVHGEADLRSTFAERLLNRRERSVGSPIGVGLDKREHVDASVESADRQRCAFEAAGFTAGGAAGRHLGRRRRRISPSLKRQHRRENQGGEHGCAQNEPNEPLPPTGCRRRPLRGGARYQRTRSEVTASRR
jgi:hypothetical protein